MQLQRAVFDKRDHLLPQFRYCQDESHASAWGHTCIAVSLSCLKHVMFIKCMPLAIHCIQHQRNALVRPFEYCQGKGHAFLHLYTHCCFERSCRRRCWEMTAVCSQMATACTELYKINSACTTRMKMVIHQKTSQHWGTRQLITSGITKKNSCPSWHRCAFHSTSMVLP